MAIARSGTNNAEHSQIFIVLLLLTFVLFVVRFLLAVPLDRGRAGDSFVAAACDLVVTMIVQQCSQARDVLRCNKKR